MTKEVLPASNMGQVIKRVNELIELAKRKEISTWIDDDDIAEISATLADINNFTQQKIGKSFAELKCDEVDFTFLTSYKNWLLKRVDQGIGYVPIRENILSLHSIFIFAHAYDIAYMNIDMFELFLETTKQEGVI